MKPILLSAILLFLFLGTSCTQSRKDKIIQVLGEAEYTRLMNLSGDEFDQTPDGFRKYSGSYELMQLIIPEYIEVNKLSEKDSRNLHWHLGQVHALNNDYPKAIEEMKQSYVSGSLTWKCYVDGTIAFLEKDKGALMAALDTLRQQDNQMNIEFLEKFVKYFDKTYSEAYNALE